MQAEGGPVASDLMKKLKLTENLKEAMDDVFYVQVSYICMFKLYMCICSLFLICKLLVILIIAIKTLNSTIYLHTYNKQYGEYLQMVIY